MQLTFGVTRPVTAKARPSAISFKEIVPSNDQSSRGGAGTGGFTVGDGGAATSSDGGAIVGASEESGASRDVPVGLKDWRNGRTVLAWNSSLVLSVEH